MGWTQEAVKRAAFEIGLELVFDKPRQARLPKASTAP